MRPLRVGIDARKIRDFGIGRYLEGLLSGLAELEGGDRYVLFLSGPDIVGTRARLRSDRFEYVECSAPLYSLREQFAFVGVARRHRLDLMHYPHYVRTMAPGCPVVVTIQDAIHLSHPPSTAARVYATVMIPLAGLSSRTVLCGTAAARDDIRARFPILPLNRFRVTPYGLDDRYCVPPPGAVREFRDRRGLSRPFALCIASHRPHKNLRAAVDGFRRGAPPDARLVLPARDPSHARDLQPFADGANVILLTEVGDDEMPLLYAAARIVVCPSLAEGFGFAPLEAAGCGAPVLASDIRAHREVMADAVAFSSAPNDATALAVEIARLWPRDDELAELAARGPERARRFSWRETATATRRAYCNSASGTTSATMTGARIDAAGDPKE